MTVREAINFGLNKLNFEDIRENQTKVVEAYISGRDVLIIKKKKKKGKSALADHVIKTNHDIAWNEATILRTNNNWRQRKILEAWEINCAKDPLNRDDGALLPKEYLHLTIAEKKKWH